MGSVSFRFWIPLTRNGTFKVNTEGVLTTQDGYVLDPLINVPAPKAPLFLSEGGRIWSQSVEEGAHIGTKKGDWLELGTISLTRVPHPEGLKESASHPGYYQATHDAGLPEDGQASENGFGLTLSGVLEDFSQPAEALPDSKCWQPSEQKATGRDLDWAIDGQGYFVFISPNTGEKLYTRQAHIQVNPNGELISSQGYKLDPAITLLPPADNTNARLTGADLAKSFVRIDPDGVIWSKTPEGGEQKLGLVTLALIEPPEALHNLSFSHQTLFHLDPKAGQAQEVHAGQDGAGTIHSGVYEDCGQDILPYPEGFLQSVVTGGL